ncbi:MAG: hypothetical protein Q9166_001861 [cf. Caloplaca sp. 2 TL-2023]
MKSHPSVTEVDLKETYYLPIIPISGDNLEDELHQDRRSMEIAPFSDWLLLVHSGSPELKSYYFIDKFVGPPALKVPVSALTATVFTTVVGTDHCSWSVATPALSASNKIAIETSMAATDKVDEPRPTRQTAPITKPLDVTPTNDAVEGIRTRTLANPPPDLAASEVLSQGEESMTSGIIMSIAVGDSIAIVRSKTPSSPEQDLTTRPGLSFLGSAHTMDKSPNLTVDGQTITPGGKVTILGSAISVPTAAGLNSQALPETLISMPAMSFLGSTYTMDKSSNFFVNGQTIKPGDAITVSSSVVSMPSDSSLIVLEGVDCLKPS